MATVAPIPLAPEDLAILALESDTVAGHTCKVIRLGSGAPDLLALRVRIEQRIAEAPLLTCRLASDGSAWVPDPAFDVERHVTAVGGGDAEVRGFADPAGVRVLADSPGVPGLGDLPVVGDRADAPGARGARDRDAVLDVVAALFAQRLPRDRPLWKMDVVALPDGGALLVWRIHHALADGTTTMRYARTLLWDGEGVAASPHAAAAAAAQHAADDARRRGHLAAFLRREYARTRERSPFDGRIGTRREIGFAAVSLPALHDTARGLCGATVNDAVLTIVAGALRRWLERHHGSLGEVRVKVPVSLHREGEDASNRTSFFALALPLDEPDPVARLRAVQAQTSVRKADRDAERRERLLEEIAHVSPQLRGFAARLERSPRRFALSVSNVVGPREPVHVLTAPVDGLHSLAEIGERHALRIAVTSFHEHLCFGLLADPVLVPDVRTMAAAIEQEAGLLAAAAC